MVVFESECLSVFVLFISKLRNVDWPKDEIYLIGKKIVGKKNSRPNF